MIIGLLADTHDNLPRTEHALALLEEAGAEVLLHAGDLTSGRIVPLFDGPTLYAVEGNNDDAKSIRAVITKRGVDVRYADVHNIELGGLRIGIIHGDDGRRFEGMVASGAFDVVVHGHTHEFRDEREGRTRIVNPGAVHRTPEPSVCVLDTTTRALRRIVL